MKNIRWTLLAALILAAPTTVQAQDASTPPAAESGAQSGAESGTVTNAEADTTTTTTTTTSGIEAEGTTTLDETTQTTELANTGGAPLVMSLGGMAMAMGAFFLRRRVSN